MLVVSYYTPCYRETAATYLLSSLMQAGIRHDVREVPGFGNWQANTQYKSAFLLRMHDEYRTEDLLWLDADARVYAEPSFPACDIGVHFLRETELLSGTIWLPAGENRGKILASWHAMNMQQRGRWDQKNLQDALAAMPEVQVGRLPPELCFIFDTSRKLHPDVKPIIEHFQASRQLKKKVS